MGLLGAGAMTAWWDVASEVTPEFEDWHSHEHMPERLAIPGFLRGSRWIAPAGSPKYFVLYEVETFDTLTSAPYLERLNNPTPWSKQIMRHVRNMTRSLCGISGSFGSGVAQTLLTIRLSPAAGEEKRLRTWLMQEALPELPAKRGMVAAHLLESKKHTLLSQTQEQKLRGGDAAADWVILAEGYDSDTVTSLTTAPLSGEGFESHGASSERISAVYQLAYALTSQDVPHDG